MQRLGSNELLLIFDDVRKPINGVAVVRSPGAKILDCSCFGRFRLSAQPHDHHFDREKVNELAVIASGVLDRVSVD
jgi:hypothetical protein